MSRSAKLIFGTICTLAALCLTLSLAKDYLAWDELSIPVFLIYSVDNNLDNSEKEAILNSFGLDARSDLLRIIDEKPIRLFCEASKLLAELERTSNETSQTLNLYKLDSPTSLSKRELRQLIEKSFVGEERAKALRRVIVVLDLSQYSGKSHERSKTSLADDMLYIKHNFGGVGLLVNKKEHMQIEGMREAIDALKHKTFYY